MFNFELFSFFNEEVSKLKVDTGRIIARSNVFAVQQYTVQYTFQNWTPQTIAYHTLGPRRSNSLRSPLLNRCHNPQLRTKYWALPFPLMLASINIQTAIFVSSLFSSSVNTGVSRKGHQIYISAQVWVVLGHC